MGVSVDLANLSLAGRHQDRQGDRLDSTAMLSCLAEIVAVDPPSVASLAERHIPMFTDLGRKLHQLIAEVASGDLDAAAERVNALLESAPAYPHLAKDSDGVWRLHHHPVDIELVPMWIAICAEAIARLIGTGHHDRLGICSAGDCGRAYFDQSKNSSRRFCSTTCQNRTKAAAFRSRRVDAGFGAGSAVAH